MWETRGPTVLYGRDGSISFSWFTRALVDSGVFAAFNARMVVLSDALRQMEVVWEEYQGDGAAEDNWSEDPMMAPEDIPDVTDEDRARWRRETARSQVSESYEPTGALTIDELLGRIDDVLS